MKNTNTKHIKGWTSIGNYRSFWSTMYNFRESKNSSITRSVHFNSFHHAITIFSVIKSSFSADFKRHNIKNFGENFPYSRPRPRFCCPPWHLMPRGWMLNLWQFPEKFFSIVDLLAFLCILARGSLCAPFKCISNFSRIEMGATTENSCDQK